MPGVPRELAEHSLNVWPDAKLVKQPLRRFAEEKRKAIGEEIARLLAAGFIMEVFYLDWLANPVLVLKKNNTWCICIDYTSLNKACPKDPFTRPRIDQVIDSTAGQLDKAGMTIDPGAADPLVASVFHIREIPS
jgi:hypothetical protein